MANEFSIIDVRLIRSLIWHKSDADIAMILGRTVEEVTAKIHELTGSDSPYQAKLNKKQEKNKKALEKKKQEHKKEIVVREQVRKEKKAKKEYENNKAKEIRKLIARQNAERQARNKEREKPLFTIRQIDYSQLRAIRIDHRTVIYAKPGEDIELVKRRYLDRIKESKSKEEPKGKAYKEVKKFKPI